MSARLGWSVVIILGIVIIVLATLLWVTPAPSSEVPFSRTPSEGFISEKVRVTSPLPNAFVSKKFTVRGEARGTWFFEAQFPVQVRDKDNNKVGQGIAHAKSDWMTEDFVPFEADVTVENYSGPATLVLLKDNPSGLPENDDSVSLPIIVQ